MGRWVRKTSRGVRYYDEPFCEGGSFVEDRRGFNWSTTSPVWEWNLQSQTCTTRNDSTWFWPRNPWNVIQETQLSLGSVWHQKHIENHWSMQYPVDNSGFSLSSSMKKWQNSIVQLPALLSATTTLSSNQISTIHLKMPSQSWLFHHLSDISFAQSFVYAAYFPNLTVSCIFQFFEVA